MSGRWGGELSYTRSGVPASASSAAARTADVRPSVCPSLCHPVRLCGCVFRRVARRTSAHIEQSSAAARRRWSPPLAPWAGWRLDNLSECRPVSMSSTRFRHATIRRARTTILRSRVVSLTRSICERVTTSSLTVKVSPYSIAERSVPELMPVLGSQPARDVSHKPGGRLLLLFARPAVTPATLKRAATYFTAW